MADVKANSKAKSASAAKTKANTSSTAKAKANTAPAAKPKTKADLAARAKVKAIAEYAAQVRAEAAAKAAAKENAESAAKAKAEAVAQAIAASAAKANEVANDAANVAAKVVANDAADVAMDNAKQASADTNANTNAESEDKAKDAPEAASKGDSATKDDYKADAKAEATSKPKTQAAKPVRASKEINTLDDFLDEYAQRFEKGQSDIDFFELVRLLDLMSHKPSFGFAHNTTDESLRSSQNFSLSYAKTALHQIKPHGTKLEDYLEALPRKRTSAYAAPALEQDSKTSSTEQTKQAEGESADLFSDPAEKQRLQELEVLLARPSLITNFFGLFGPNGPMPLAMSEYFYKRVHNFNDKAGTAFINIINHKFLGLFYRAYFCQQQALGADRSGYDFTSKILLSMLGCDFQMVSRKIDAQLSLSLARFLSQKVRSASMLETALQEFFALPIHVQEYRTERYLIPLMYRAQLLSERTIRYYKRPDRALILGQNVQIGEHYLSRTKKFTIEIANVTFAQCEPLLPGRWGFYLLGRIVTLFLQSPLDFDLVFKMSSASIPASCLNAHKNILGVCAYLPARANSVETLRICASHLLGAAQSGS